LRTAARARRPQTMDQYIDLLGLPSDGALRASVGLASNVDDVERLLAFVQATYTDRAADTTGLAPGGLLGHRSSLGAVLERRRQRQREGPASPAATADPVPRAARPAADRVSQCPRSRVRGPAPGIRSGRPGTMDSWWSPAGCP